MRGTEAGARRPHGTGVAEHCRAIPAVPSAWKVERRPGLGEVLLQERPRLQSRPCGTTGGPDRRPSQDHEPIAVMLQLVDPTRPGRNRVGEDGLASKDASAEPYRRFES